MSIKRYITTILFACMAMALTFAFNDKISFAKDKTICIEAGDTVKLPLKNAKSYKYRCSKKSVVKIKNGKITALKKGKCLVKATKGKKKLQFVVKVSDKKLTSNNLLSHDSANEPTNEPTNSNVVGVSCKELHSDYPPRATADPTYFSASPSNAVNTEKGDVIGGGFYLTFTREIYKIEKYDTGEDGRPYTCFTFINSPELLSNSVTGPEITTKQYIKINKYTGPDTEQFKVGDEVWVSSWVAGGYPKYGDDYVLLYGAGSMVLTSDLNW